MSSCPAAAGGGVPPPRRTLRGHREEGGGLQGRPLRKNLLWKEPKPVVCFSAPRMRAGHTPHSPTHAEPFLLCLRDRPARSRSVGLGSSARQLANAGNRT